MPIIIPEPHIPCVDDPQLLAAGYPLSNLGQNLKIEYTSSNACCPYTKKNQILFTAMHTLPCIAPCLCGIMTCYYRNNPEIQISHHVIPGTLCPMCRIGKIRYAMIADGECTDVKSKELYICDSCNTIYPEYNIGKYFGPDPPWIRLRRRRRNSN